MNAADDQKVREVVENIINHPSFRASLSNILNNSCDQSSSSSTATSTRETSLISSPGLFRLRNDNSFGSATNASSSSTSSVLQSNSSTTNRTASTNTYTTPSEEFSALFRQGSSRGRAPIFQRGISHRQSARARRRAATVPYTRGSDSNRHRKREIFRSKEVILLPDSKTDRIVRASEKASLMERGLVLNEVMIDKNWSDKEVFQYLDECFKEKLSSESFSSVDVGGTTISTRYAKKYR